MANGCRCPRGLRGLASLSPLGSPACSCGGVNFLLPSHAVAVRPFPAHVDTRAHRLSHVRQTTGALASGRVRSVGLAVGQVIQG